MPELAIILGTAAAVFAAGVVQGTTGFGYGIVAVPILAGFPDPKLIVPMIVTQGIFVNSLVALHARRYFEPRRVWLLIATGIAFTPIGALLLVRLNSDVLRIMVGAMVGLTALAMLFGFRRSARNELLASIPVGAAGGVLTAATGLAAAPVVLFFTNQKLDPRVFRANTVFFGISLSIASLPSFIIGRVLSFDALTLGALAFPAGVMGIFAGIWLSSRVSVTAFRRLALVVVVFASAASITAGSVG